MRFGIHFMDFTIPGEPQSLAPVIAATARASEEAGAAWFTVMDHYFQIERYRTALDPMLEGYTALGFVAAHTQRIKLGTVVTGVTYRHPGLLAKIATTLDVLSEGRSIFGLGAGWYEREHRALGVPFPPLKERFERLEETIRIALQMWSDDDGPFEGEHYRLAETICRPLPVQTPRPPILIGGSGERKTLRLVARYGDITNLIVPDPETAARKLAVLREHCDAEGRDYDAIEKTVQGGASGVDAVQDPDAFLATAEAFAAVGIEHIHLRAVTPDPEGWVRAFGDKVAPRLTEIPVAGR
ncbi:TIGR03560 family F420-dependent LLM class oxidoreductase [soil metagenome]